MRRLLMITGLCLLSACATGPEPVPAQTPEAREGSPAAPTPALPSSGPAPSAVGPVESLLVEARRLREDGDLPASFARLERALRIAPHRAEVYLELARSHRAAGNDDRASASAERGLLYCSGATCGALRSYVQR